jgi:hypothetical protein
MDADRFYAEDRLDRLSLVSGIEKHLLRAATIYPVALQINGGSLSEKSIWPWMLATGARNTKRRGGLQYCPVCLASDKKPYYRLQWRHAWHVCCEQHECALHDRCHACHVPIEPHRLRAEDERISVCASCKVDLSEAAVKKSSKTLLKFQHLFDQVVLTQQGKFAGQVVNTQQWFELAAFFATMIRRARHRKSEKLTRFLNQIDEQLLVGEPLVSSVGMEMLRTTERQSVFESLYPLMTSEWERFHAALTTSEMTFQSFCTKDTELPDALKELTKNLPGNSKPHRQRSRKLSGPRSRFEVMKMMIRLQRKLEMSNR